MLVQHIFISYAHNDGDNYRDELIAKLREAGFKDDDYWYDKRDIEFGEEWRREIDKALDESFIVIIILTPGAVRSHAVTYEWAKAISDSLKVIPVWFKPLKRKFKHPLVERKQWGKWSDEGVADKVIETIGKYSEIPPDVLQLNKIIINEVALFRILTRLALWFYSYVKTGLVQETWCDQLLEESLDEGFDLCSQRLPKLMVYTAFAFTSKQKRLCRNLTSAISNYVEIFYPSPIFGNPNYRDISPRTDKLKLIASAEQHRAEIFESTLLFFDTDSGHKASYARLDYYVSAISKGLSGSGIIMYPPNEWLRTENIQDILRWPILDEEKVESLINAIEHIKTSKIA